MFTMHQVFGGLLLLAVIVISNCITWTASRHSYPHNPTANQTCQLAECMPEWVPSPWGPCSKLCGDGGWQSRSVQCQKIISNGYPTIVDENQCFRRLGDKPAEEHQKCNVNALCPTWFIEPWKPCDKLCGDGKQTRQVVCRRKTNGRVEVLVDESCEDEKPETDRPCNIHPCDGIDWVVSNWTGCDSCVSKFYTREALCVTKHRLVLQPELCSYHRKPELQKTCDATKLPPCESQSQYATQGSNVVKCEGSAENYPALWYASTWSECTKGCNGGTQYRKVMCLSGGNASTSCPEAEMPDEEQSCNLEPCNIDELLSVSSTTEIYDDLPDCEEEDQEVDVEMVSITSLIDVMSSDASSTRAHSGLSAVLSTTTPRCRPRNEPFKCTKSKFGCCPDKKTAASGPFDEGCPSPTTCKVTKYGCCPDGVSAAGGPRNRDCPVPNCEETLYGCCKSDRKTTAEGNDQEGCPPACKFSKHGCCADNETQATGSQKAGCPETSTTTTESPMERTTKLNVTTGSTVEMTTETTTVAVTGKCVIINGTAGCHPCSTSEFGCCSDGQTAAHGPNKLGCCLLTPHGCCPDNFLPANGANLEGCDCKNSPFGCCPDQKSYATGANHTGCGCEHTPHGCCPDRHTEATGPNFEGCSCHTYQFGCCPDGVTAAIGFNLQGCRCEESQHGCCGDGVTPATGPNKEGCDCASSKYGCCPDGVTESQSKNFTGCAEALINKQAACALSYEKGNCTNYSIQWFYDMDYGGCSRFHYGGCGGNGNRFAEKAECEAVCIKPAPRDTCHLPKVMGTCKTPTVRWYYDDNYQRCLQFHWGGCLGNQNNFETQIACEKQCSPKLDEEGQCQLPIEEGPCAGNYSRWGYNETTGRCEEFLWGGCQGNPNRFISEAACMLKCNPPGTKKQKDKCTLPASPGDCRIFQLRWFFDTKHQQCRQFPYGGCGGNANNFLSEDMCKLECSVPATPPPASQEATCLQPTDAGGCSGIEERWTYSPESKKCVPFKYTGCGGNANNFPSKEYCEFTCRPPQDICEMPKEVGPCRAPIQRWYYDRDHGQCQEFIYGGCFGNKNNFETKEECRIGCELTRVPPTPAPPQDVCSLAPEVGPCREAYQRFYYNPAAGRCEAFTYGGCGGNQNSFESAQECEQRCAPPAVPPRNIPTECRVASLDQCRGVGRVWYLDPASLRCTQHDPQPGTPSCNLPGIFVSPEACERACGDFRDIGNVCRLEKDAGPCSERQPKFYFDEATGSCQSFTYGGCYGSANRFSTEAECESVCLPDSPDPCKLQPSAGNCSEQIERWYYDEARDQCGEFYYTGCGGNENSFASKEECEGRCKSSADPEPQCRTPESLLPCGEPRIAFYYDHTADRCVQSEIGGCIYNPNNYHTEEECLRSCGAFKGYDVCREPLNPGPCRVSAQKFYWNLREGRCEPYTYGGCEGSANRFSNQAECEKVCGHLTIDTCHLPKVMGTCKTPTVRWYYDDNYQRCLQFHWGGCLGNQNNFETQIACEKQCSPKLDEGYDCKNSPFGCCPDQKSYATGANHTGCGCEHTPHGCCPDRYTEATGPNFEGCSCHTYQFGCCPDGVTAAIGFNLQGCRCKESQHGCCGDGVTPATGPNKEGCDCASSKYGCCPDGVTKSQSENFTGCAEALINKQAACALPYETGNCTNYSIRWFYDMDYGGCSRFHYSGCGGNGNRFADMAECEAVCIKPAPRDACHLPTVRGSCSNSTVRWYYDHNYQRCLQFHWGGCLGNNNNYKTQEECEKQCSPTLDEERQCQLPIEKGPCAGNYSRWGYTETTGSCEEFLWGGCQGNPNRFISEAACMLKCNPPGKKKPVCDQPQDTGPCTEINPYWSYSKQEDRCVPFYYGGCGGNENKFSTQEQCEHACPKSYNMRIA